MFKVWYLDSLTKLVCIKAQHLTLCCRCENDDSCTSWVFFAHTFSNTFWCFWPVMLTNLRIEMLITLASCLKVWIYLFFSTQCPTTWQVLSLNRFIAVRKLSNRKCSLLTSECLMCFYRAGLERWYHILINPFPTIDDIFHHLLHNASALSTSYSGKSFFMYI